MNDAVNPDAMRVVSELCHTGVVLSRVRLSNRIDVQSGMCIVSHNESFVTSHVPRIYDGNAVNEMLRWSFCVNQDASLPLPHYAVYLPPFIPATSDEELNLSFFSPQTVLDIQAVDTAAMLSLQWVFDFHCNAHESQQISGDDFLVAAVLFVASLRMTVLYLERQMGNDVDSATATVAPFLREHKLLLAENHLDVDSIDAFCTEAQQFAASMAKSSFRSADRVSKFIELASSAGLGVLCAQSQSGPYCGKPIISIDERQLNTIKAFRIVSEALQTKQSDVRNILMSAMLHGANGYQKMLGVDAMIVDETTLCRRCGEQISIDQMSKAMCHVCSNMCDALCRKCTESAFCEVCATAVDMEKVAVRHMVKTIDFMSNAANSKQNEREKDKQLIEFGELLKAAKTEFDDQKSTVQRMAKELATKTDTWNAAMKAAADECSSLKKELKKERRANKNRCLPDTVESVRLQMMSQTDDALRAEEQRHQEELVQLREDWAKEVHQTRASCANEIDKMCRIEAERREALAHDAQKTLEQLRRIEDELAASRRLVEEKDTNITTLARTAESLRVDQIRQILEVDILREELQRGEAECEEVGAFERSRHIGLQAQRDALAASTTECAILRSEMSTTESTNTAILHLNAVWREKYAYASGQARAAQKCVEMLMARIEKVSSTND